MNIKNISIGVLALVLAFLVGMAVGGKSSQSLDLGASGTRWPNGISADTTSPSAGQVRGTTLTVTGATTLTGAVSTGVFTEGGGISTISTTSATYTLTQAELAAGNVISIANTQGAALTLTLPATSTLTTVIPSAGNVRRWYIQNLHTTAASSTTMAAGAGIELQGTSTASALIPGAFWGKLDCYRQASTNVVCFVSTYAVAD